MIYLLQWSKSQNGCFKVAYVVKKTHFRMLRAHGARKAKNFHWSIVFRPRRFQRAIARPNPSTGVQKRHNKALVLKDEPNKGIAQNDYYIFPCLVFAHLFWKVNYDKSYFIQFLWNESLAMNVYTFCLFAIVDNVNGLNCSIYHSKSETSRVVDVLPLIKSEVQCK